MCGWQFTQRVHRFLPSLLGSIVLAGLAGAQVPIAQVGGGGGRVQQWAGEISSGIPHTPPDLACDDLGSPATLPPGFVDEFVVGPWNQAVGFVFDEAGRLYVWEREGRVWIVEEGVPLPEPLIDISDEVGSWGDHGLLGVALDPDFLSNGHFYLLYVVDRHHLLYSGTPQYDPEENLYKQSTIGRVTRYSANASDGFVTVEPASRRVLIGRAPGEGIPVCGQSHAVGSIVVATDGTLLVSTGDGTGNGIGPVTCVEAGIVHPDEAVDILRAQLIDSLSGKILRVDPNTGEGVPSNPFFDPAEPFAARSRVWTLGLRNPYRFGLRPDTGETDPAAGQPGTLYVGDVGNNDWEELNVVDEPGLNFGWPIYEGYVQTDYYGTMPIANPMAPNPLFGVDVPGVGVCAQAEFDFLDLLAPDSQTPPAWTNPCDPSQPVPAGVPTFEHTAPEIAWRHFDPVALVKSYAAPDGVAAGAQLGTPASPVAGESFGGTCAVGGAWYTGTTFPEAYRDTVFSADFGGGWIRNFVFDESGALVSVEPFAAASGFVVALEPGPDGEDLYYLDYTGSGASILRRIRYVGGQEPPFAIAGAEPTFGYGPLTVAFQGDESTGPSSGELSYRWTFDDGSPESRVANPVRTFPSVDVTSQGTIIAKLFELDPPNPMGEGSQNPGVIRDGDLPPEGIFEPLRQYDTLHLELVDGVPQPAQKLVEGFGLEDWIGYAFPREQRFQGLVFQEGGNFSTLGGWFETFTVQVRDASTGQWSDVTGLTSDPPMPGTTTGDGTAIVNGEFFELRFDPVSGDGIRLHGEPGGIWGFVSVSELRVLAAPKKPATFPRTREAQLAVQDELGTVDCERVTIHLDNTPPDALILEPLDGSSFDSVAGDTIPLTAYVQDAESGTNKLNCSWEIRLHYGGHAYPEPLIPACTGTATLPPLATIPGDAVYYELRFTATDPQGLATTRIAHLYPMADCDLNGIPDVADLAADPGLDGDGNGVMDVCERDCNGNGLQDAFDLALGNGSDADGNGVLDECDG